MQNKVNNALKVFLPLIKLNVVKKEMARGAKNTRQEDRFSNEIISLFVLNARKSKNALNAKIIEVIPKEMIIAFLSLLK